MIKRPLIFSIVFTVLFAGCGMMQSIIKSTFPYTTNLTVSASAKPGDEYVATSMANSFDQNFSKSGNNGDWVSEVRIVSAKLRSDDPSDFNIGNIASAKFYMSKPDGTNEVLVAQRTDISPNVGNDIVLDIDNSNFLDQLIREPEIKVRMVYKLRNHIQTDASLRLVLGLGAYPGKN